MPEPSPANERPVGPVRGTRDWLPADFARLAALEALLLDRFARAGYLPTRTPVLEATELHERKSGAGIVAKLYEVAPAQPGRVCLRPELTASIVRAYTEAPEPPPLPWRVSLAGPVFRHERPRPGRDREFTQVGIELLGAGGPAADAEVIGLADWALGEAGIGDAAVRIGHVGLILEVLERSGLPAATRSALVERLSEAAAEGGDVRALDAALGQLAGWLESADEGEAPPSVDREGGGGVGRLFRQLVPAVAGRRSGHEILDRLRRKWELGHSLHDVLRRVGGRLAALAELRGPAPEVLDRLGADLADVAPESIAALGSLVALLGHYGVDPGRIVLDPGFGRGIGFYSRTVFELVVQTPEGPIEVCGGGRYDGLARVLGSDRDDRGVGFAFGLERLLAALEARGAGPVAAPPRPDFLIVPERPEALGRAIELAKELRSRGARVVLNPDGSVDDPRSPAARSVVVRATSRAYDLRTPSGPRPEPADLAALAALIPAERRR